MPVMNAHGTNTALSTRPTAITGAGDLLHGLDGGVARRQAVFDMVLDGLDHHDRVVDDDADRQHQPEQREIVQAEADGRHHGERADDRHGTATSGIMADRQFCKNNEHDEGDQNDGVEQRVEHFVDRFVE